MAVAAAVCIVACGQKEPATTTIAQADPRPAPTTASIGEEPAITTAGSPPPSPAVASGSETVMIRDGKIEVRPLLPRAHTVFQIANETNASHDLVLRGRAGRVSTSIPPGGTGILQVVLVDPAYEIVCTTPGHRERTRFETYEPA